MAPRIQPDEPALTPDDPRVTGTVKWFDPDRGFGFIARDDRQPDVFVHWSGIAGTGYRNLDADDRVAFRVENTAKGPQACDVQVTAAANAG